MIFLKKFQALITILFSLFVGIAVFDYYPDDPSYLHAAEVKVQNITLKYGASIADVLIQAFGYTIFWPIIVFIFHSILVLLDKKLKLLTLRISLMILTLPVFCFLVAFLDNDVIGDGDYYSFHMGGYLGYYLKSELMYADHFKTLLSVGIVLSVITIIFTLGIVDLGMSLYQKRIAQKELKPRALGMKQSSFFKFFMRSRKDDELTEHRTTTYNTIPNNPEIFFVKSSVNDSNTQNDIKTEDQESQTIFDIGRSEQSNNTDQREAAIEDFKTKHNEETLIQTNFFDLESNPKDTTEKSEQSSDNNINIVKKNDERAQKDKILLINNNQSQIHQKHFTKPPLSILHNPPREENFDISEDIVERYKQHLLKVLNDFGIKGRIFKASSGPVVTLYELEPVSGTKASRVIGLADDIARSMSATSARIAPIQGKNVIGIELPNKHRQMIYLHEILSSNAYQKSEYHLPLALGKNIAGEVAIVDLAKMPHLLVAGTTGSGKSVGIHAMIMSLLYRYTPEECKFIMIDPKMLELSVYDGIQHLLTPVITTPERAVSSLKWVVNEMESRYRAMSVLGVRNINSYNNLIKEAKDRDSDIEKRIQVGFDEDTGEPIFESIVVKSEILPYIVVIIDEMADLMVVAGKDIEVSVQRLAQMARAAGIHIIMSTQRPSVDVITGVIKANFPTRISFRVTSKFDSRVILGEMGAEQLLGEGDMLYMMSGSRIKRLHGVYVQDEDIEATVQHIKKQGKPTYISGVLDFGVVKNQSESSDSNDGDN